MILFFTLTHINCMQTHMFPELAARGRHLPLHYVPGSATSGWLAGWPTVARPAVRYGPVRLALMPAHLPELTRSLPHHLSRRTKCAVVSWQSSPKCQPGVTNPCRPLGPRRPGSVGRCPGSDGEPGTCHGNNNR